MVFSTILFLCVFLPLTILIYFCMPVKCKNYFLLFASLMFYAWGEPKFVFVMLASIFCNYIFGLMLARIPYDEPMPAARKWIVFAAVLVNMGVLFVFKYLTFGMENLQRLIPSLPVWDIALPIGISFYTFQGLSYVIDVYREEGKPNQQITDDTKTGQTDGGHNVSKVSFVQRNPIKLALYISMFPQLIAGPIVRYKDIKDSLSVRKHSLEQFSAGVSRFIIGLSKKAILANMMGQLADSIMHDDFSVMGASVAWIGAISYTLQIYFDFSGYSDMAIGLGKIFGFTFLENFNYPYISTSIREFWRRWHISLSGWFRDYLYIPLGGSRRGNVYVNLLIVFLATGLWHGAAWGFVLWGLWHGLFSLIERFILMHQSKKNETGGYYNESEQTGKEGTVQADKPTESRMSLSINPAIIVRRMLGWVYTMFVVIVGWVLFAIVDVKEVVSYLAVMFGKNAGQFRAYDISYYLNHQMSCYLVIACLACIPWKAICKKLMPKGYHAVYESPNAFVYGVQKILLIGLLVLCYLFIINSSYNPFIYFRF